MTCPIYEGVDGRRHVADPDPEDYHRGDGDPIPEREERR